MLLAALALLLGSAAAWNFTTPLDEYIALPDPVYSYFDTGATFNGTGYSGYILNMTSQQWLTEADCSVSIWWHYMAVVVPDNVKHSGVGALYLTYGSNTDPIPTSDDENIQLCTILALSNGLICTVLYQIPNQPIVFALDPLHMERSEDDLIAFTWWHYTIYNTSEPFWLARLPMTKAAVRAMDTVTDFAMKKLGQDVSQFIVAGASKRGWTTWTTGAVDTRVIAIVPIVMDALNFVENVLHFYRAYGGWTFALQPYYVMNFTREIDFPSVQQMASIIDPFVYRTRLTMPKLVIDAGGDEFFMPDDNHYWFNELAATGETHLLFIQDAEHSMSTGLYELVPAVIAFIDGVVTHTPRPSLTWQWFNGTTEGNITIFTSEPPVKVTVWHADTLQSERRDWRLVTGQVPCPTVSVDGDCFQPVLWYKSFPAVEINPTTFTVTMDAPESGWRAFFMTVEFKGVGEVNYRFSTQVVIVPNIFPFPECEGDGCYGTLL